MSIAALLFDVDGTLAETEEAHREAFNAAFHEHGYPWVWDRALYADLLRVTGGKERIRHYLSRFQAELLKTAGIENTIRSLHEAKNRGYWSAISRGAIDLRPGIRRLIADARQAGLRLAIATTTSLPSVRELLVGTLGPDSPGWFDTIVGGDMVAAKKPAPDIYSLALEKLGLAPNACMAFEDSANGLRSALAARIPALITVSAYTMGQDFAGAVAVLSDLGEPGAPLRVFRGDPSGEDFVSLNLLRRWHEAATSPA
ncbi:MAG: HAD family hydrolase [Rhodospirillaceae bacterium]|nr:HAD family hydrolase [Rhodospirillaceae bacterium]